MDIFLTNLRTGSRLRFPALDQLNVKTGINTSVQHHKIETKIPRGTWSRLFLERNVPGTSMRACPSF